MGAISFTTKGDWSKTLQYLKRVQSDRGLLALNKYGAKGVAALAAATPVASSETANSWYYEIVKRNGYYSIRWHNRHVEGGIPIVVLLQYGHGTKNGGFVQGRDFIMPAIRPIFDQIANEAWREVTK